MRLINLALCIAGTLAVGGCASPTPVVVKLYPPAELLLECEHPTYKTKTNGDLADGLLAYGGALDKCNIDKASLRAWSKE